MLDQHYGPAWIHIYDRDTFALQNSFQPYTGQLSWMALDESILVLGKTDFSVSVHDDGEYGGDWPPTATLSQPNGDDTSFGISVAVTGTTLFASNSAARIIFVFERDGTGPSWTNTQTLVTDATDDFELGRAMAASEGILAVGEPCPNSRAVPELNTALWGR